MSPHAASAPTVPGSDSYADTLDLSQVSLSTLIRRCTAESEHFFNGQPNDTRYAYEIFRRALVEHNEAAWHYIYMHYSSLVERWVRRCSAFSSSSESSEYFVAAAYVKFWRAITPERFTAFANVAALLQYLHICTSSVVIDNVRAQNWDTLLPESVLLTDHPAIVSSDDEAMERVSREDFWRYVNTQLHSEAERTVVYDSFILGMRPGEIYQHRANLFANVKEVYGVKRNVLERLSRNVELRQLLGALSA